MDIIHLPSEGHLHNIRRGKHGEVASLVQTLKLIQASDVPSAQPDRAPGTAQSLFGPVTADQIRLSGRPMSNLARASADFVWHADASLCLTSVSEGFYALTGLLPLDMRGTPFEVLGRFVPQEGAEMPLAALLEGKTLRRLPFIIRGRDKQVPVYLSACPIRDSAGTVIGYEGAGVRVALPVGHAARDEKEGLPKPTAAHPKAPGSSNHAVSLTQPLHLIRAYARTMGAALQQGDADQRYGDYAEDIYSAGRHLLDLLEDLAQPAEDASDTLAVTEFDVNTVVRELERLLDGVAAQADLQLCLPYSGKPLIISSDRRRLKQICLNLLENAIKYTPAGRAVGMTVRPESSDLLIITVWDEGPGISADKQKEIWQRFAKGDDCVAAKKLASEQSRDFVSAQAGAQNTSPGLGVGLSVAKVMADSIGARLSIDSGIGRGSRFILSVPIEPGWQLR